MARTWLILARVIRVVPEEAQAQAEHAAVGEAEDAAQVQAEHAGEAEDAAVAEALAEQAAVGEGDDAAQAQAEEAVVVEAGDAAPGEAEVAAARAELEQSVVSVDEVPAAVAAEANNLGQLGLTVSVAPPPRVTFVTARHNSLPDDDLTTDMYPYIIASGSFCLLAHFARNPYSGTDLGRVLKGRTNFHHLIVLRHFHRAGGQIAATAVRVPARPRVVPRLRNIESVGLVCDSYTGTRRQRTYNFRIAELMVETGRTTLELVIFRSDRSSWFSIQDMKSPLVDWDRRRRWVPHGAVAVHSTVVWFDLSWGILCCDVGQEEPEDFQVSFYRLPRDRVLPSRRGGVVEDIHTKRCIAVSGDLLRYVEIIVPNPNGQAATVCMWSLRVGRDGWRWIANYSVRFEEIWNHDSYAEAGLQPEIPVLAGVCPVNPDVVYFDLHHRLFGVNVPERRVVDSEANPHELVNVPKAPQSQTGSSRYLLNWNLLRPGRAKPIIGHVSPDLPDDGSPDDPEDEEPQDPKGKGKSKATDGRRKSASASSSRPSKVLCIK